MQAATRRSIHSAFVQLQLSSRYRRSPLLLRQLAATTAPANGVIILGTGRGRVGGVRFLSCSVRVRSEGKSLPDEHAGAVNSGGAAEPEQGGDVHRNSSQPALPTPNSSPPAAVAPTAPAPPASSEIGKQSTDSGSPAEILSPQVQEDTPPQETSDENKNLNQQQPQREPKPRGRPAGSGGIKRRQPTKAKEKDLILKPEVPAWFLRDGVLMVEDNLTRPTKLDVWITQERSKDPAEELTEVLEACQEGFPAEAPGQEAVVEQIATSKGGVSEVATQERGGGIADAASQPSPAIEPDPPVKDEETGDAAAAAESESNLKDEIESAYGVPLRLNDITTESGKDNQLSVKVSLNKLVQTDHTLQPAFSETQGVEEIVNSAAKLGEDVESHLLQLSHGTTPTPPLPTSAHYDD